MKQTVLISGSSRGIGSAIARQYARNEFNVVINYNSSKEQAEALRDELVALGTRVLCCKADVSDSMQVEQMVSDAIAKFGTIDVLVNNAGVSNIGLLQDVTDEQYNEIFDVNVRGVFNLSRAVLPTFISNKSGSIVNISSVWGQVGASCEVVYSASKGAVIAFTKALAKEVAPSNIRVNCVSCGLIDTQMNKHLTNSEINEIVSEIPLMRIGSCDEVAKVVYSLSDESVSSYITGQVVAVSGGWIV